MSVFKFLFSKTFVMQLLKAAIGVGVISVFILIWLKSYTNHGEFIEVPPLTGKTLEVAEIELRDAELSLVVMDSANYNPNYPSFSVIEQAPAAGSMVKENRKIYITLNPSGYRKIAVPDIIRKTLRQARPTLEAIGFEVGTITYKDDIGKDEVIGMSFNGESIDPGSLLEQTSKIDLVLGNGKRPGQR